MPAEALGIGHACLDRISVLDGFPDENASMHIQSYEEQPGGTAANALAALAGLGVRTAYLSPLGDDDIGREVSVSLRKAGIDLSLSAVEHGTVTHFTNVIVNRVKQTRTFCSWHGRFQPIAWDEARRLALKQARVIHLDNTCPQDAIAAARLAREAGTAVSLDGSSLSGDRSQDWELASCSDVLICSESFPQRLTGLATMEALQKIQRELHPQVLIMTMGERGCIQLGEQRMIRYPAFQTEITDTVGAGDAFHGGYLYGWLRGLPAAEAVRIASAVAAMSLQAAGGRAGLPDLPALERFLSDHEWGAAETL